MNKEAFTQQWIVMGKPIGPPRAYDGHLITAKNAGPKRFHDDPHETNPDARGVPNPDYRKPVQVSAREYTGITVINHEGRMQEGLSKVTVKSRIPGVTRIFTRSSV